MMKYVIILCNKLEYMHHFYLEKKDRTHVEKLKNFRRCII